MSRLSAFEILGPVMVGPSSSHTAGALRCARVAASLMEGSVTRVRFTLWNSFAHTYRGHGSDRALVAGILGLDTDDERIRDALSLAREQGLDCSFIVGGDDGSIHPNTVDIEMAGAAGERRRVRGESLGGGRVRISRIDGVSVDLSGEYDTLFIAHRDERGVLARLTVELSERGINIAFMRTYRTARGGSAYTVFELDELPEGDARAELVRRLRASPEIATATVISIPGSNGSRGAGEIECDFSTAEELLELCDGRQRGRRPARSIGSVMRTREESLVGGERATDSMKRVYTVMRKETTEPIERPRRSLGGFIGGEARAVRSCGSRLADALMGPVQTDAVARAMAVLERSASMGVIVAAPTAGSSGIVPGCVLALADHLGSDESELFEALFCASAVGLILTTQACVAGAEGGCQAEVGSAAAMAAAACAQLLGAEPAGALNAASLALSNLLGLVCDPVQGLVEVPCQNRNAIGVACALSSAQLSLSGVESLVSFDEMADVMCAVGHALPPSLRETAQGGIAQAPTALRAKGCCGGCD
ncbi:L-serine dehydratase, iron-sulfur-dependent, beta subunit [Coriobacterium glomerans PW2]|uniref:L-serine dehydratase n=1 Tax=Coriobacterium glomerans (strain ATCC 49209 / DSM 20642 / JCM 10262 / PW2) TaxID=700015 RepID=F2N9T7_CORGP|nr:L-serine ammonia-lyase, iron-sulfur-dependent subunit beta [Coriobacterium glomerans]AEB07190.1 L-serine dehydratase, iron-sulfur-dependent, beta subunit [Coriobacterium glomerans PW2]